jgi:hypothetical protein
MDEILQKTGDLKMEDLKSEVTFCCLLFSLQGCFLLDCENETYAWLGKKSSEQNRAIFLDRAKLGFSHLFERFLGNISTGKIEVSSLSFLKEGKLLCSERNFPIGLIFLMKSRYKD